MCAEILCFTIETYSKLSQIKLEQSQLANKLIYYKVFGYVILNLHSIVVAIMQIQNFEKLRITREINPENSFNISLM